MAGLSGGQGGGGGAVRAGRAYVEFFGKDGVSGTLTKLEGRMKRFGNSIASVGAKAAAFGAAGLAPVVAAIGGLRDLAKQGDIAAAMGLSVEAFTGIAAVAKSAGEDTREFIESLVTLGKVASEGALGKGEVAAGFFKDLNLDAKEFASLKADEQFYKFFEAVQGVADPLARVRLLMVAFGEDGGKLLLPLLSKTPDELRRMGGALAVTAEDMKAAKSASEAYTKATAAIGKTWEKVVVVLAPAIEDVSKLVPQLVAPMGEFVKENKELVTVLLGVAAGLTAGGVAVVGFGLAISSAGKIVGVLALAVKGVVAAVGLLLTPLGAAGAAVAGLAVFWLRSTEAGREAASELAKAFRSVGEIFAETFGGIEAAVKSGNLKLAFEIAAEGVKAAWFEMLAAMAKAFAKFVEDNREKIIALGGVLGAIKGGRMGGVLGPLGLIGGVVGGGLLGGFGGDKLADALKGIGDTKGLDAAAEAAKARLAALVAGAKAVVPAPGVPVDPAEVDRLRQQKEMNRHLRVFDMAKGAFFTPAAKQQFGYGDGPVRNKELNAAEKTAANTAKTAVEVARLVLGLKMA